MKTPFSIALIALVLASFATGCASKPAAAARSSQTKYIYLPPETGSRVPRRVAVNPDGSVNEMPSGVSRATPEAGQEMQRRGNVGGTSN